MIINKLFLCLALANLSNTDFKMKPNSLKTACQYSEKLIIQSEKQKVSPFLMASLIWVESRFEKKAISNKKACGLTQVLAKYSKYSCKSLQKPSISIEEGVRAFTFWYEHKKNIKKALECYNSGYYCNSPSYSKQILTKTKLLKTEYKKIQLNYDYLWRKFGYE